LATTTAMYGKNTAPTKQNHPIQAIHDPANTRATPARKHTVRIAIEIAYRRSRRLRSSDGDSAAVVISNTCCLRGSRGSGCTLVAYAARYRRHDGLMTDRTYRITEIVGTSPEGITEAVNNGIKRASQTLRHLDWFEVQGIRGQIVDDAVSHYQVTLKIGFRLEDDE
jgi:flavin-binding protein dodecin